MKEERLSLYVLPPYPIRCLYSLSILFLKIYDLHSVSFNNRFLNYLCRQNAPSVISRSHNICFCISESFVGILLIYIPFMDMWFNMMLSNIEGILYTSGEEHTTFCLYRGHTISISRGWYLYPVLRENAWSMRWNTRNGKPLFPQHCRMEFIISGVKSRRITCDV